MATLTENLINGSGSNTYNYTFPTLETQDVRVQLREFDPTLPEEDQIISQISTTAFEVLSNPSRVVFEPIALATIYQDLNGNVKVTSSNGHQVVIRIYRDTDIDDTTAYFYPGSAIRAEDLNDNFKQLLFAAQETDAELEDILGGIWPDDSIPGSALKDGAVTTAKLADNAVTTDKVLDGAIMPSQLDRVYVEPGDNVSDLVNDANYVSAGDNVTDLVNDANYISVGDNVSDLVNDLNYLEPGDNVSELTNDAGYITASEVPPTGVTQIVAGNNVTISPSGGTGVVTVNSTGGGGGGGGPTKADIYGTAKAWAMFGAAGGIDAEFNVVSVTKTATGRYTVVFASPMASSDYAVTTGTGGNNVAEILVANKTASQFEILSYSNPASGTLVDSKVDFSVFDNEPAEIIVGSGTVANTNIYGTAKAYGQVNASGGLKSSSNCTVSTTVKPDGTTVAAQTGIRYVTFITPLSSNAYGVTSSNSGLSTGGNWDVTSADKSEQGFKVIVKSGTGTEVDQGFDFAVYDEEPAEVALTTFGDVINYSGAAVWGNVASDGTLLNGLNSSVVKTGQGAYTVTFQTALPDANYSVAGIINTDDNLTVRVTSQSTTGFDVVLGNSSNNRNDMPWSYQVAATNALPPKGGTGADCWGSCDANGVIEASFNVASVTKSGTGIYDVLFTTPMPTANYAVTGSSNYITSGTYWSFSANQKTTTGFRAYICRPDVSSGAILSSDSDFSFTVNATNATLPLTVTQEQIESAINNPGLSAWGFVNSGALQNGMNVNSVISNPQVGVYDITFINQMPDSNYSVAATSGVEVVGTATSCSVGSKTPNGCRIFVNRTDTGASINQSFQFQVVATNALPPKGGTGADAWLNCQGSNTNGLIAANASFNIHSITRTGQGTYNVLFNTPMPTSAYSIIGSGHVDNYGALSPLIYFTNQSKNGFSVIVRNESNALVDIEFNVVVHATNATLPATLTQDMLVMKAGDTMTGGLTVPSLTNGSNNLPIHRGSIDPAQTQSFTFTTTASDWYPFDPWPSWCNHIQYKIYTNLTPETVGGSGLYLRFGSAAGQIIPPQTPKPGQLMNGVAHALHSDLLYLNSVTTVVNYSMVYDLYLIDYGGITSVFARAVGTLGDVANNLTYVSEYSYRPTNLNPVIDRVGCLLHGGTGHQAWVSQTFMTDGFTQTADFGPTPTPI